MARPSNSLLIFLFLCWPSLTFALDIRQTLTRLAFWRRSSRNVPAAGYVDPNDNGGSMLTKVLGITYPDGQGEPVNAILSGNSDSEVLVDQETDGGLRNYFFECLGQHSGTDQQVNLGDGNGYLNETAVIRYNYGDPSLGACTETIKGGNHFRYWVQNGNKANTGAVFMAVSYEKPIADDHDIVLNGYNLARDYIIGNITGSVIPTLNLTNSSTYSGNTSYGGYTYKTDVSYVSGLLENTSIGINHNWSVYIDGVTNAVDGLVAVLDVSILEQPQAQSAGWRIRPETWLLLMTVSFVSSFCL
ncbi:hypothetical protein EV421DRAFT_1734409 [Armillaria borealis]|uniref:Uncharacterized protein n=1 Tax=Armillaria borealis TaxID=47425 RepID=A0AA39JNE8_9AGAR|nr:hypothetical protein EV421DRAFT_1734409 [Armillaria borealis]